METEAKDKKSYEISFLVKEESAVNRITTLIRQHGGDITLETPVRSLALSYKIKKESTLNFGYLHFDMLPEELPALDRNLKTATEVVRFLIITPPFVKAKATSSPLSRPRATKSAPSKMVQEMSKSPAPLSNEALEKKIEEILQ